MFFFSLYYSRMYVMESKEMLIKEIKTQTNTIYLLGTAHISEKSVRDVLSAIETIQPDIVAVELDEAREKKLKKIDQNWQNLNMFKVIRQKKALFLLSTIVLSSFQKRLGENLSVAPGEEMLTAINECAARNIPVVLADRSAEITLKRAWNKSSFFGRQKIIASLISSVFSKEIISEGDLEDLKQQSTQGKMMEELSSFLPELKQVLVDERDEYLAMNIMGAKGNKVLAVLGAAHVPGIIARITTSVEAHKTEHAQDLISNKNVENDNNTKENETNKAEEIKKKLQYLESIPKKKKTTVVNFLVPLIVLGLFAYGFYRGGIESISHNFIRWWLINGCLSLMGAIVALAHPVTMLLSFLAAPLTSLNPFIGVGIVTGLSETFFRTPRVRDFEQIQELSLSIKALYKNRITRILIVLIATTIGSAIGTFVGVSMLITTV